MPERKINLKEILDSYCDVFDDDIIGIGVIQTVNSRLEDVKKAIKEACRQTLELAAKNAKVKPVYIHQDYIEYNVNEKSILDTIKQIE